MQSIDWFWALISCLFWCDVIPFYTFPNVTPERTKKKGRREQADAIWKLRTTSLKPEEHQVPLLRTGSGSCQSPGEPGSSPCRLWVKQGSEPAPCSWTPQVGQECNLRHIATGLCPALHHSSRGLWTMSQSVWKLCLWSCGLWHLAVFVSSMGDERVCSSLCNVTQRGSGVRRRQPFVRSCCLWPCFCSSLEKSELMLFLNTGP